MVHVLGALPPPHRGRDPDSNREFLEENRGVLIHFYYLGHSAGPLQ